MDADAKRATTGGKIEDYGKKVQALMQMGGEKALQKQRGGGKMTARERLDHLFDKGSFQEVQLFVKHRSNLFGMDKKDIAADGVITGFGKVNGRTVFAPDLPARAHTGQHAFWKVMDMAWGAKPARSALRRGIGGVCWKARRHFLQPSASGYIDYRHHGATAGAGLFPAKTGSSVNLLHVHHRPGSHQSRDW